MKSGVSRRKSGQMQISFGMIFSIILVVAFLAFAFYAIRVFINAGEGAQAAKFIDEFQDDINRIWNSEVSLETNEYGLPGYADFVCLIDFSSDAEGENSILYPQIRGSVDYVNNNMAFWPVEHGSFESALIRHIDIETTTSSDNPLCFGAENGKVRITLRKDMGEALVTVERAG